MNSFSQEDNINIFRSKYDGDAAFLCVISNRNLTALGKNCQQQMEKH